MNPPVPSSYGKIVRQKGIFCLGKTTNLEERKLQIRNQYYSIYKSDLVSHPALGGRVRWIYTMVG